MKSLLAVPVLLLALGLASCSTEVTVEQAELEKQLATQITPDNPEDEVTVSCDGDLAGEVDATQDCPATIGEQEVIARVTVTAVDGTDVEYEITPVITAEIVAETIKADIVKQGFEVETVECEEDLVGEEGQTLACTAAPSEGDGAIEVKVTSVDGLLVNFDYEVVG